MFNIYCFIQADNIIGRFLLNKTVLFGSTGFRVYYTNQCDTVPSSISKFGVYLGFAITDFFVAVVVQHDALPFAAC